MNLPEQEPYQQVLKQIEDSDYEFYLEVVGWYEYADEHWNIFLWCCNYI